MEDKLINNNIPEGLGQKNDSGSSQEETVTYQQILDKIREVYSTFVINSEEMRDIFDKKYANAGVVQLLDEQGQALRAKLGSIEGERIEPKELREINSNAKERHIRGLLYILTQNPVDLTKRILQEKEILEVLKTKGVDIEGMIEKYKRGGGE